MGEGKNMSVYFVDFENVNSGGLTGITKTNMNETDRIIIFYSENAKTLTMDLHRELEKTKVIKEYVKVNVGTANALDFQLASYLGAYIEREKDKRYFIVSKDLGFDAVCDFWKSRGIILKRIDSVSTMDRNKEDMVKALNGILTEKEALKVYKIVCSYKTKEGIHNNLVKTFPSPDNKKASEIYKAIKPLIKDKKDT